MRTIRRQALFLFMLLGLCRGAGDRFVILSDLHPHPRAYDQLQLLTEHVIRLQPAFAVALGDMGGDHLPGPAEQELDAVARAFRRMRACGIEVYPAMGNHDVNERVAAVKVEWLCAQQPAPINGLFARAADTAAYRAFRAGGPYSYSFNRGGIHFCVLDSNCGPRSPRWEAHRRWMVEDLAAHTNNPDKLPTLVFLHHPEFMSGARGMAARPLFRVLEEGSTRHTVKAVFGGHWHYGEYFPPGDNLGIDVYATPASVHDGLDPVEFIVAEVTPEGIVFTARDTVSGRQRTAKTPVEYRTIPGQFRDLERLAETNEARTSATTVNADLLRNGSFENGIWYSRFRGWSP